MNAEGVHTAWPGLGVAGKRVLLAEIDRRRKSACHGPASTFNLARVSVPQ